MTIEMQRVVVTIDDASLKSIDRVVGELARCGLHVSSSLPTMRIVTGEIAANRLAALQDIPGVVAVEPDQEMRAI